MNRIVQLALLTPWLAIGGSAVAEAAGDRPGGGGPSANVPPVGAGGSGPTDTNIGTGGRNELRDRYGPDAVPGMGFGGGAGAGGGGGVVAPPPAMIGPEPGARKQKR